MRKGFFIALLVTALFAGGYFYYIAEAICPVPLSYSLGTIDEKFDLSADEARLAVNEAESVWENATGRNLFTYAEDGDLTVNFVFDERQEFVNEEDEFKEKLDATENVSEAIKQTYEDLVEQYNKLKSQYNDKVNAYETKLEAYNAEVEKYNKKGGAPADVYELLSKQKDELDAEQTSLNTLSGKMNVLVKEINNIGEKGNSIVNTYNQGVIAYNKTFGEPREFTQGDYTNKVIKIYSFEDAEELKQVLVHELGHALSLDHVENKESEMYYLIGDQPSDAALSEEDLAEFERVCGNKSIWDQLKILMGGLKK